MPGLVRGLVALVLALAPGTVAYLLGRRLRHASDDPALPEKLLRQRQLVLQIGLVCFGFFLAGLRQEAAWGLPLMLVATLALGFPARRALFSESWGLGAYLVHIARWSLAGLGFWALLAAAPLLASVGPGAAVVVALVLAAWGLCYGPLFVRIAGAGPLLRVDLEPRFAAVLARSHAPAPRRLVAGHPGGRWANAFALPSLFGPSVLFTRTLIEAFEPEEIEGIFAHEVAHLEHHDRKRLLWSTGALFVLIPSAVWGVAWTDARLALGGWLSWMWPLLVLLGLAVRTARHQTHEAESDRRAVELLGGDPEPLARALIKLHALGRLPRRFDVRMERSASHPSLARRLQALRAGSAAAEPALGSTILETARDGALVILDSEHAHWLEGVPADAPRAAGLRERAARVRSLAYSELSGLHVQAGLLGRAYLKATDLAGKAWTEPLRAEDVARTQAALDGVDARLGRAAGSALGQPAATLLCLALMLAGLLAGRVGVYLLPVLVGAFGPTSPVLVAAGASALLEWAIASPAAGVGPAGAALAAWALPLAALGVLLVGAWRARRGGAERPWPALTTAVLLIASAVLLGAGIALGALQPPRLTRLHLLASDGPGAGIALVALASLLAAMRRPAWAAALALPGLAILGLGTSGFAARFVEDPWLRPAPALRIQERVLQVLASVELPAPAFEARLSPDGMDWAVREYMPDVEEDAALPGRFRVGRFGGASRTIDALDLALIGNERVLALTGGDAGFALELSTADHTAATWSASLPRLAGPALGVDAGGAWWVTGWSYEERGFVLVTGRIGSPEVARRDLAAASREGARPQYLAGADETLVVTRRVEQGPLWIAGALLGAPAMSLELGWLGAEPRTLGSTPLEARCLARRDTRDFVCAASRADRSSFFRLAEGATLLEPLGALSERSYWEQAIPGGRLCARLASGAYADLDFASGTASRLRLEDDAQIVALAFGERHLAALGQHGERSVLTLHASP